METFFRKFLPRQLDRQIMLLVSLLLGLVIPSFALHEAKENTERVVASASLQAQALAENIAVTSIEHIITQDFASTEQLLLRSARFPGVMNLQVTDIDGQIMGDVVVTSVSEPTLRYDLKPLQPPVGGGSQLMQKDGLLIIWEPIIGADAVGWVKLTYSLAEAERIAQEDMQDYLIDGLIMVILLVTLILLLMRRPLNLLRDAAAFAEQLKDKSGAQMAVVKDSIEVEQLSKALNETSTNLHEQEAAISEAMNSLKQMTDHLEDLVKQRTTELEQANIKLQKLNKVKSEFVSVVSHELRTPLTSIISFAEILKNDIEELDLDDQKHFLTIINDESARLGRLINDLLDLQKMDSGKTAWKDFNVDLIGILQTSVEFFSQAFADKGLELKLEHAEQECMLPLDIDRIKQVIANLFSNALKFTEHGGVTVTLSADSNMAKVSVCDTGLGIPDTDLSNVFETFHQVDSSETRAIGGSGLGLAISKEIIEHYRGKIWVESSLGEGSCFYFTLPLTEDTQRPLQEV